MDKPKYVTLDGPKIVGRAPTRSECRRLSARLAKYLTRHKIKTVPPPEMPPHVAGYFFGNIMVMWQYRIQFHDFVMRADAFYTE